MRILHLAGGDLRGGAARGAHGLHDALRRSGVDSTLLTTGPSVQDPSVKSLMATPLGRLKTFALRKLDRLPLLRYRREAAHPYSVGWTGWHLGNLRELQDAEILHLHWVNGGFLDVRSLASLGKPIVWTLRDMWPFTGGCHYAIGCGKYRTGCGACPQLNSTGPSDISRIMAGRKRSSYPPAIRFVGISRWVTELAATSFILRDMKIDIIPNSIDCDVFRPQSVALARSSLDIHTAKKLILVGAQHIDESYKGLDKLLPALSLLDRNQYALCVFGQGGRSRIKQLGFEMTDLGLIRSDLVMRNAYSAADVFVAPSVMEAFGKTIAESMACGTPVVCFDIGGPRDIVDHLVNGYRAAPFSSEDLATGIEWATRRGQDALPVEARRKIVDSFSPSTIAARYRLLYEEMLGQPAAPRRCA